MRYLLYILCYFIIFAPYLSLAEGKLSYNLIRISTGSISGMYYPIGGAICNLLNNKVMNSNIVCRAELSNGSIDNLENLLSGKSDIALVQSDVQFNASHKLGNFTNTKYQTIRSLFSIYKEGFILMVRGGNGIYNFSDLKGKIINLGPKGSGSREVFREIIKLYNINLNDFKATYDLNIYEQSNALCDGRIDAALFIVGHPNQTITEMLTKCDTKILPFDEDVMNKIIENKPYFIKTIISMNEYPNMTDDIETVATVATVITTDKLPVDHAYMIVKEIFSNIEKFKDLHPLLGNLETHKMIVEGIFAPLHIGAQKYYKENNLY